MFNATKEPAVRPESEREIFSDLHFYLSLISTLVKRLEFLQNAAIEEQDKESRRLPLFSLFNSIQEQFTKRLDALSEKYSLNATAASPCDESPCRL